MINKIIKVQRGTKEINRLRTTNQTLRIEKCNLIKANERKQKKIDKAIGILENIYMLDNVTITDNSCKEIDKAINILKGEDK